MPQKLCKAVSLASDLTRSYWLIIPLDYERERESAPIGGNIKVHTFMHCNICSGTGLISVETGHHGGNQLEHYHHWIEWSAVNEKDVQGSRLKAVEWNKYHCTTKAVLTHLCWLYWYICLLIWNRLLCIMYFSTM